MTTNTETPSHAACQEWSAARTAKELAWSRVQPVNPLASDANWQLWLEYVQLSEKEQQAWKGYARGDS